MGRGQVIADTTRAETSSDSNKYLCWFNVYDRQVWTLPNCRWFLLQVNPVSSLTSESTFLWSRSETAMIARLIVYFIYWLSIRLFFNAVMRSTYISCLQFNGYELENYRLIFKQPDAYITLVRAEKLTWLRNILLQSAPDDCSQRNVTPLYVCFPSHLVNKSCIWLKVFFNLVPARVFRRWNARWRRHRKVEPSSITKTIRNIQHFLLVSKRGTRI